MLSLFVIAAGWLGSLALASDQGAPQLPDIQPPHIEKAPTPAPPPPLLPVQPPQLQQPPVSPPPKRVPKAARPKTNPATWLTNADYPKNLTNGESGTTGFRLTIGKDGRPIGCQITIESGYAVFDQLTCKLLMQRARFYPAIDDKGKPTKGTWSSRAKWNPLQAIPAQN